MQDLECSAPFGEIRFLLDKEHHRQKAETQASKENATLRMAFLTKAVSIFGAFLNQRFFNYLMAWVLFGRFITNGEHQEETLCVSAIWFTAVYCSYPVITMCLGNVHTQGCRKRRFREDSWILIKEGFAMCLMWSYRDLARDTELWWLQQWLGEADAWPSDSSAYWFNRYDDSSDMMELVQYLAVQTGMLCLTLGFAVGVFAVLDSCNSFPTDWIANSPFALAIGVFQANFFTSPWYFFPWDAVRTERIGLYGLCVRTVCAVAASKLMSTIMYHARALEVVNIKSQSSLDHARKLLLLSLPYAFAWQWTQWGYEVYFHCIFNCPYPFTSCGDATLEMWFGYCVLITVAAYVAVPVLSLNARNIQHLDNFYSENLLPQDKLELGAYAIRESLFSKLFGIGTGWAYTNLVSVECSSDFSPTCPPDFNFWNVMVYLLTVLVYLVLAILIFHRTFFSLRLQARTNLVRMIEQQNTNSLFEEIDNDKDGYITLNELRTFLEDSGLDSRLFIQAFENVTQSQRSPQDNVCKVPVVELVREFTRTVEQLKNDAVATRSTRREAEMERKADDAQCTLRSREISTVGTMGFGQKGPFNGKLGNMELLEKPSSLTSSTPAPG